MSIPFKDVHPQLAPEDVQKLEAHVITMVDAIGDAFSEAGTPISVGVAVCLTLIIHAVSHADQHGDTQHLRQHVIEALRNTINFLERAPTLVEGPERPM